MRAFKCDACGDYCDGVPISSANVLAGEFEITISVQRKLREVPEPVVEEEENTPKSLLWSVKTIGSYFDTKHTHAIADLCQPCFDSTVRSGVVLTMGATK